MTQTTATATATATASKGKATLTLHGAANAWSETGKRAANAQYVVVHTNLTDSRTENWAPDSAAAGYEWASMHATLAAAEKVAATDSAPGRDGTRTWDCRIVAVTRPA